MTTLLRPHLDQRARDLLEDLGLATSENGSATMLFDDHALDTVEALAE